MATATVRALRSTWTRALLIALTVTLLLGYGLFTAQRARSATTTLPTKLFTGVTGIDGNRVHPQHVFGVSHPFTGAYNIKFDRHVDNCSVIAGATEEPGNHQIFVSEGVTVYRQGLPNFEVQVHVWNGNGSTPVDGDFDVIAICPNF